MAEIKSNGSGGSQRRRGGQRSKKLSTRVDLTPMVDLGFLLITFFIFTTTMNESKSLHIVLPANPKNADSLKISVSGVLTLIPIDHDSLYYYEGSDPSKGMLTSGKMLREVIMRKKATSDSSKFMVVLKPSAKSTYKNVVNLLDEMLICDVRHYVMTDAAPVEMLAINAK